MKPAEALSSSVLTQVQTSSPTVGFDEAFVLYHRSVYQTAYALLHDAGLAEDVTQEVFLRYYRYQHEAPNDELLRPWLLRVAINVAHNTRRTRSRADARDVEFFQQTVGPEAVTAPPDADYERRAEIEEARRALAKIDEPMRSCLLLKQQGLSYKEIAVAVSVNESYVGSLIARGRKEFARVYGKVGGGRR